MRQYGFKPDLSCSAATAGSISIDQTAAVRYFAAKGHLNVKVGFLLTRQRMGFDMVLGQNRLYEARLELSVMRAVFLRYFISAKAVLTFGQLLGLSPR